MSESGTTEKPTDWQAVAFGVCLGALASLQQFKLPPALPLLFPEFGYSKTLAGSFMSIYALAGLFVSIPAGRALARRGPLPLLRLAFAAMLAGNLLWLCLAQFGIAALSSRALESLGFALLAVVGAVVATTSASTRDKPLAVALWAAWIPMGQIISTLLAIPFVSVGQWRPLWLATGIITIFAWAWGEKLFSRTEPDFPPPAAPAVSLQSSMSDNRHADKRGLLLASSILFGVWSGQYITYVTWLPQFLVESHGLDPGVAARAFLLPCVLVVVFNLWTGKMLRNGVSMGTLLVISTLLQAGCWLSIPYTRSVLSGVVSLGIYGATSGVTATTIFSLPGKLLAGDAPRGFAALMTGRNFGVLVGPVLLAQLVVHTGDWSSIPVVFGAACVGCALLGARVAAGIKKSA